MIWPFLSITASAMSITSVVLFIVTSVRLRQQIAALRHQRDLEQRTVTLLREELSRRGVETIIEPAPEGYAVTFRSHQPRLGTPASVQPWRGPIGRA